MLNTTNGNKIDASLFIGDAFEEEFNREKHTADVSGEKFDVDDPEVECLRERIVSSIGDLLETYDKIDRDGKINIAKLAECAGYTAALLYNYYSLTDDGYKRFYFADKLKREVGERFFAIDDDD